MAKKTNEAPLGSGERFRKLTAELERKGAEDAPALAAWIGRKRYSKKKFQKLAAEGRSEHSKAR